MFGTMFGQVTKHCSLSWSNHMSVPTLFFDSLLYHVSLANGGFRSCRNSESSTNAKQIPQSGDIDENFHHLKAGTV